MKKYLLPVVLLFASCAIKGNIGGLVSNYHKMQSKRPDLYASGASVHSVCELTKSDEPKVYTVHGEALKRCLATKAHSLVYIWSPRCASKICVPLEILQQQCDARKLELFVVAEYYDNEHMAYTYRIKNPILGIDIAHYGSNFTQRYLSQFLSDLNATQTNGNKFLLFEHDRYLTSYHSIDDVTTGEAEALRVSR